MKNNEYEEIIKQKRRFMKSSAGEQSFEADQKRGVKLPPLAKPQMAPITIPLPNAAEIPLLQPDYYSLLQNRRSQRFFANKPVSLEALAFMLWSTQGVQKIIGKINHATLRTVPSGGCRHPYETYIAVRAVQGLKSGIYHYLPLLHHLELLREIPNIDETLAVALQGQVWAAQAAVILFWAAVPYRCEWRYADSAERLMLLDAGHIGQNAYLSAEALGLATCCVAAYQQQPCDTLLGLDGENEFTVYLAPIGFPKENE